MSRRLIFLSIIIVVILGGSFYFFSRNTNMSIGSSQKKLGETIQFSPFPIIISNETGKKDNLLYEALINKSDKPITVSNGTIDLSGLVSKSHMMYHNFFINFHYDIQTERVSFEGHSLERQRDVKIKGSYGFNDDKQIDFDVNLQDSNFNTSVKSVLIATSQDLEDGYYSGAFKMSSENFWQSTSLFSSLQKIFDVEFAKNVSANIEGKFTLKNKSLSITDMKLSSDMLEFDLSYQQAVEGFDKLDLNISKLNFDKIILSSKGSKIRKIRNIAAYLFGDYNIFGPISGLIKGPEIILDNNFKISDFILTYDCNDKDAINIHNLSFDLDNENKFTSNGVLKHNNYRPVYVGKIEYKIKNPTPIGHMSKLFDGYEDKVSGSIEADVMITPVMMNITNYKLTGDNVKSSGNIRLSYYGNNFKTVYSEIDISNLQKEKKQNFSNIIENLSENESKSNNVVESFMNFKKFNSLYDVSLVVSNSNILNNNIRKGKGRFVLRNSNFNVHDVKIDSDSSDIMGQFGINVEGVKPYITWKMKGDYCDARKIFNLINLNESSNKNTGSQNKIENDVAYTLSNKDITTINLQDFDGYINFDFKKLDVKGAKIKDFFFDAVIDDELMKIRKMNMSIYKGYLQSLGNVTFNPLAFNMAYSYAGGDVYLISEKIFDTKRFSGGLNMTGNIFGKGANVYDLIQSLGGSFSFKYNKLLAKKFNLKKLLATYGTNVPESLNNQVETGNTLFKSFVGKATLGNGKLNIKDANFSTKYSDGKLSSEVNLINGDQNSLVSFAFVDKKGKVDGFNISFVGPINKPKVSLGVAARN